MYGHLEHELQTLMNIYEPFPTGSLPNLGCSMFQMNIHDSSLGEGGDECSGSPVMYSGSSSRTNHASANGSIITMTLKNNHLIVETEERNVRIVGDGQLLKARGIRRTVSSALFLFLSGSL